MHLSLGLGHLLCQAAVACCFLSVCRRLVSDCKGDVCSRKCALSYPPCFPLRAQGCGRRQMHFQCLDSHRQRERENNLCESSQQNPGPDMRMLCTGMPQRGEATSQGHAGVENRSSSGSEQRPLSASAASSHHPEDEETKAHGSDADQPPAQTAQCANGNASAVARGRRSTPSPEAPLTTDTARTPSQAPNGARGGLRRLADPSSAVQRFMVAISRYPLGLPASQVQMHAAASAAPFGRVHEVRLLLGHAPSCGADCICGLLSSMILLVMTLANCMRSLPQKGHSAPIVYKLQGS